MKASDIMTRKVISIEPDASIMEAVRLMLQHRISGLPVVDTKGKLVGILSEGDLLRRQETGTHKQRARWVEFLMSSGRLANEYVHSSGRKVHEVMTRDPRTVVEDTPVEQIVQDDGAAPDQTPTGASGRCGRWHRDVAPTWFTRW